VTVKCGRELINVTNMIAKTSASSTGDRICVKFIRHQLIQPAHKLWHSAGRTAI